VTLGLAVVVAGSVVSFGVAVVGSFLGLPPALLVILSLAGIAAIVYPIVRAKPSASSVPPARSSEGTPDE
jgi:hypothetical protein